MGFTSAHNGTPKILFPFGEHHYNYEIKLQLGYNNVNDHFH